MQKYRLGNDFKFTVQVNQCCGTLNLGEVEDLKVFLKHTQNGKTIEVDHVLNEEIITVAVLSEQILNTGTYGVFLNYKVADVAFESSYRSINTMAGNISIVGMCESINNCEEFKIQ